VAYERSDVSPLHASATGKAILAFLEPKEQKKIIQDIGLEAFTDTTITDPKTLEVECARIREAGFSESHGEAIEGTHGIAAPIFSISGRVVASIGASVPVHRAEGEDRLLLIRLLTEAATQITQELSSQEAEPATTQRFRRSHHHE
jgi:DNA-binding IclR family transcriptional regulator